MSVTRVQIEIEGAQLCYFTLPVLDGHAVAVEFGAARRRIKKGYVVVDVERLPVIEGSGSEELARMADPVLEGREHTYQRGRRSDSCQ